MVDPARRTKGDSWILNDDCNLCTLIGKLPLPISNPLPPSHCSFHQLLELFYTTLILTANKITCLWIWSVGSIHSVSLSPGRDTSMQAQLELRAHTLCICVRASRYVQFDLTRVIVNKPGGRETKYRDLQGHVVHLVCKKKVMFSFQN